MGVISLGFGATVQGRIHKMVNVAFYMVYERFNVVAMASYAMRSVPCRINKCQNS